MYNEKEIDMKSLAQMMIRTYPMRFGDGFWSIFEKTVKPNLSKEPFIFDLGTGPGLFLKDIDERINKAKLYGYDSSKEMIRVAKKLNFKNSKIKFEIKDIASKSFRFPKNDIDLIAINFTFHHINYPVPLLTTIRKSLNRKKGTFLIYDWVRSSLKAYLEFHQSLPMKIDPERLYLRFTEHNRYSLEDIKWLLEENGFKIKQIEKLTDLHCVFIAKV